MEEKFMYHSEVNYALFNVFKNDYETEYLKTEKVCYFVEVNNKRIKVEFSLA